MKIIKASRLGFCFGVKEAISTTEQVLKEKKYPVQFLGSLVHNELVIERFLRQGIVFIKKPEQIKKGVVIIQAHGFAPFENKLKREIIVKDATCRLVKKVRNLARALESQNYKIIILGDKNHAEIKGIQGYLKYKMIVIKNENRAKKLGFRQNKKIAFISQTTQNTDKFKTISKILKKKYKNIRIINTICPEVQTRQKEAKLIIKQADMILLIGSAFSANTRELYAIVKKEGKPVLFVNSLKQVKQQRACLKNSCNKKNICLGIISGTSADNSEIKKIIRYIHQC